MNRTFLHKFGEKFGTVGVVLAAAACPLCFPKIALVGAAVGLGSLAPLEGYTVIAVQLLFVLALVGHFLAFPRHRNRWLLALAVAATLLLFIAYYLFSSSVLLQVSVAGLVGASAWLAIELRRCARCTAEDVQLKADALRTPAR